MGPAAAVLPPPLLLAQLPGSPGVKLTLFLLPPPLPLPLTDSTKQLCRHFLSSLNSSVQVGLTSSLTRLNCSKCPQPYLFLLFSQQLGSGNSTKKKPTPCHFPGRSSPPTLSAALKHTGSTGFPQTQRYVNESPSNRIMSLPQSNHEPPPI